MRLVPKCTTMDAILSRRVIRPVRFSQIGSHTKQQVRTVVIAPSKHRNNIRPRQRTRSKKTVNDEYRLREEDRILTKKINEIQELARNLKLEIKRQDEERVKAEVQDLDKPVEDEEIDLLYNELLGDEIGTSHKNLLPSGEKSVALFDTPADGIKLPETLLDRIGDSVKNIVSKENQNWGLIINELYANKDGFTGLPSTDVGKFLQQIPVGKLSMHHIEQIQTMLTNGEVKQTKAIVDFLMKHLAENNEPLKVQALFDDVVAKGHQPTPYMFGHLIKVYTKAKNIDRINIALEKMYKQGLEPSVTIYTNVLKLCSDLKDFKKAEDVFQMMKFRSTVSKPDIRAYDTMIDIAGKNNDIYKANDLYHEMLDNKIKPSLYTYNTLAKICSKNEYSRMKGWEYIMQIRERNLEPNMITFEVMLRLAAKDGDLELSRALYLKIYEMQLNQDMYLMNQSSVFLMMAYRDFKFNNRPQLLNYPEGALIRRNTISLVDFVGLHQNLVSDPVLDKQRERYPPLLPLQSLSTSKQIIAESNAVWTHHLLNSRDGIVTANMVTYLRIAIEHGDKAEFMRRFETFTYPNSQIAEKPTIEAAMEPSEEDQRPSTPEQLTPPALRFVEQSNIKIERNSDLYVSLIVAGRRFKDIELCEKAWLERAEYRKTAKYLSLPEKERTKADFKFAYEMVLALLELDLVYDAVEVVKSSQRQFKWTFYLLKPLYKKLLELGDDNVADTISAICNKSLARRQ